MIFFFFRVLFYFSVCTSPCRPFWESLIYCWNPSAWVARPWIGLTGVAAVVGSLTKFSSSSSAAWCCPGDRQFWETEGGLTPPSCLALFGLHTPSIALGVWNIKKCSPIFVECSKGRQILRITFVPPVEMQKAIPFFCFDIRFLFRWFLLFQSNVWTATCSGTSEFFF